MPVISDCDNRVFAVKRGAATTTVLPLYGRLDGDSNTCPGSLSQPGIAGKRLPMRGYG